MTVLNVLNVIKEQGHRDALIRQAAKNAGSDKPAYFQIHDGDRTGVGKETVNGWQNNRKLPDYIPEIEKHFSQVERHGDYLEARNPPTTANAKGNTTFDPRSGNVAALQAKPPAREIEPEEGFYSGVSKILNRKMPERASAEQVKAIIKDAPVEDVKWSGVNQAIDRIAAENNGKVPKGALLDYLGNEGQLQLQEHELSEIRNPEAMQAYQKRYDEIRRLVDHGGQISQNEANRRLQELNKEFGLNEYGEPKDKPRYSQYVLPGGNNYREVVLSMPPEPPKGFDVFEKEPGSGEWFVRFPSGTELGTWMSREAAIQSQKSQPGATYTSSHFPDVPNYVAHSRINERTDANGKPGTFIEELQSDRHQAAREKGYVEPEVRKRQQELLDKPTLTDAEVAEIEELSKAKPGEIPDAPFRKDWPLQMFKRTLRDAVESGKKWIGWTTGGTQFERWGSEKFDWEKLPDKTDAPHEFGTPEEQAGAYRRLKEATDAVINTPVNSTAYPQAVKEHEMAQQAMIDTVPGWGRPEHHVKSWRLSGQEQFQGEAGGVNMEQLARERGVLLEEKGIYVHSFEDVLDVVRRVTRDKDKAQGMAEKLWKKMQAEDSGTSLPRKEGMEGFYDTNLPSEIGKYVKQWGGKVEQGTISRPKAQIRPHPHMEGRYVIYVGDEATSSPMTREQAEESLQRYREAEGSPENQTEVVENGRVLTTYDQPDPAQRRELAQRWIDFNREGHPDAELRESSYNKGTPIWKVDITPQMQETVGKKGQSLFGNVAPLQRRNVIDSGEAPVKDSTDVTTAPLTPMGSLSRFLFGGPSATTAGYKRGGFFSAANLFDKRIYSAILKGKANGAATIRRAEFLVKKFDKAMIRTYTKDWRKTLPEPLKRSINTALGNVDNRLTDLQVKTANRLIDTAARTVFQQKAAKAAAMTDPEVANAFLAKARSDYNAANDAAREAYRTKARSDNVRLFEREQQQALAFLPPDLRDVLVQMNDVINDLSVSMLWLTGKGGISTNMRAAIAENIGTYLHRSYDIFDDNKRHLKWLESQDPRAQQVIQNAEVVFKRELIAREARRYGTEMRLAGTPVTRAQAIAHATSVITPTNVESMLNDYKRAGDQDPFSRRVSLMGGEIPGKTGTSIITERGQIPREIRELWGEQHDVAANFLNTYVPMARFLEKKSFQEFLLTDGIANGYVWKEGINPTTGQPWSPGLTHPPEFMPLKAGSEQTMGQLEGVHVVPELAEAYKIMTNREVQDATDSFIRKSMGWTLAAKTRGSVTGTARNFWGNGLINLANGNTGLGSAWGALKTGVVADFLGRGSDEVEKKLIRATQLGVVGDSVNANAIKALVGDVKTIKTTRPYMSTWDAVAEVTKNIWTEGKRKTSQIYQEADDFWKIYAWDAEMNKLRWAYQGTVSEAQIEEEAAKIVRRTTPTYSEAWQASQFYSKGPGRYLAPFIMFKMEMLRSTIEIGRQAVEEMQSPNGRVKAIGAWRLGHLGLALSTPLLVGWLTKWLFGWDDKEEEALRRSLPDYQKDNMLFFGSKTKEGPSFIDLGFMDPYASLPWKQPLQAALRTAKQNPNEAVVSGLKEYALQFFKPVLKRTVVAAGGQ